MYQIIRVYAKGLVFCKATKDGMVRSSQPPMSSCDTYWVGAFSVPCDCQDFILFFPLQWKLLPFFTNHVQHNLLHIRSWKEVPLCSVRREEGLRRKFYVFYAGLKHGLNYALPQQQNLIFPGQSKIRGEQTVCTAHGGILSSYTCQFGNKLSDSRVYRTHQDF